MKLFSVRKCLSVLFVLCLGLVLLDVSPFTRTAQAGNNYQRRPPQKPKPREYDKIVSVDLEGNSVTIYDHMSKAEVVYKTTKMTKVSIDGEAGEFSQLSKGMNVQIVGSSTFVSRIDAKTQTTKKK